MRFKDWMQKEDSMVAGSAPGIDDDPIDRGLHEPTGKAPLKGVPKSKSKKADGLFLGKKKLRRNHVRIG